MLWDSLVTGESCPPCCITLPVIWVQFFLQQLRAVVPAVLPPSPFPGLYLLTATFLLFFNTKSFSLVSRSPRLSLAARGASAVPAAGFLRVSQPCHTARELLLEGKRAESLQDNLFHRKQTALRPISSTRACLSVPWLFADGLGRAPHPA